ncbi:hypothetical protein K450DRAFT_255841 [Umbelopsis ramanniana AG]|uniref:Uncharacterized protein n=1 Tax=Umbelopsis ramanniana AG TaxID=1314678 RepID=A0AAD5E6J9_UMBRA|nr:uncharacterized protein K450DRAFT_255841 [Umbelopsis ramanniana AG]KAI8576610.1 hypothetical protein K450DRAFT_255841 [Umbelopsis ramanniana AG]
MELAINITSVCRIRVLLVPVGPIKKSTFWKHVELVKQFAMVRLGDVTPDLKKDSTAMFSSQVFQEGQLHFQFLTSYSRDQAYLEDFQPHRRIFGVVGIMDCQEWKDKNLSEGYEQFVKNLDKYPTAVATRCFAFDPTENQPDDTKGLIMIPNVGNMSFYMSTMMCDFASELLSQFEMIAHRIEMLQMLESPLQNNMLGPPTNIRASFPSSASVLPQPSMSSPDLNPPPAANLSSARMPSPVPMASSSTSFLKRSSTSATRSATKSPVPSEQPRSPTMNRSYSASNMLGSGEITKTKRRTPGRIQKLLADFYLLAGRLPDAVSHYNQAIEICKGTADFLWLASAMEGQICAMLLLEYLHADVGHIVPRGQMSPELRSESPTHEPSEQSSSTPSNSGLPSSIVEIPQKYESVMQKYAKVPSTSVLPLPTLVYVEACIKVARFLLTVAMNGGWNDKVVALLVQGKLTSGVAENEQEGDHMVMDPKMLKDSGVTRLSIAEWTMRAAGNHMRDIPVMDQIIATNCMVSLLSVVGFQRKAAFLMRESVQIILPLLIQAHTKVISSKHEDGRNGKHTGRHDKGILLVLERICDSYGIEGPDSYTQPSSKSLRSKSASHFGWPELQIEVLRECITVSEALPDYTSMLRYTTILLRKMYKYISKDEQIRLASTIQRIVAAGKKAGHVDSNINYWGVDLVKSIEAVKPIARKAVSPHSVKREVAVTVSDGDPFIYNPFSNKKLPSHRHTVLVTNEFTEFKVLLSNPFGFDLELQSISLSTSGAAFEPTIASTTIPANASLTIRLTGTPKEAGKMIIKGCHIKIAGFSEQEFLMEEAVDRTEENTKTSAAHGSNAAGQSSSDAAGSEANRYVLEVIPEQPLLKIRETSLLHGALMLFEGEISQINIELENIGNIPVDFITLSFSDSTTTNPLPINPELPAEEVYEVELFTKGTPVFSWEGSGKEIATTSGQKISLPPGEKWSLHVNVFGKRHCNNGTIQIDYGYIDRIVSSETLDETESQKQAMPVFYTRQLYLPLLITVSQHLEPSNWDILYLRSQSNVEQATIDESKKKDIIALNESSSLNPVERLLQSVQADIASFDFDENSKHDYCLVAMDVRNIWTTPFDIQFTIRNSLENDPANDDTIYFPVTIQPGLTTRITVPVRRIYLSAEKLVKPVPSVDPSKQFVVSQAPKVAPEQERARLRMFWYREELLKRLTATWRCSSTRREGDLQLRSTLRLTPTQLSVLQKSDIEFLVNIEDSRRLAHRSFEVPSNKFIDMTIAIRNHRGRFTYMKYSSGN